MNLFKGDKFLSTCSPLMLLYTCSVLNHKKSVTAIVLLTVTFFLSYYLDGPHQKVSKMWYTHTHTHTYVHIHACIYQLYSGEVVTLLLCLYVVCVQNRAADIVVWLLDWIRCIILYWLGYWITHISTISSEYTSL